ncbi:MAG: MBL fold metallo-hydrolase [Candidatus Cloacimonetes bacterium]|nr:MBL fold metallo-hydrolase [Candidatus Cloacimonadota bacterium]MCF8259337.1 MBL fold metallo-hydrolase [Melioribacteraceae bacterium]MCF8263921.1 MBL fold metallo-hydrolase [Melioribacteraceae bacterium]
MNIKIWGSRGSLPISVTADEVRYKIKEALAIACKEQICKGADVDKFIDEKLPFYVWGSYGSNTSCVEIDDGSDEYFICDAGSGIRDLAVDIIENKRKKNRIFNLFISHLHWDHIQGFPFFLPAYSKDSVINIYGFHDTLEESFFYQQNTNNFPVQLNQLSAQINFKKLKPDQQYDISGFKFSAIKQEHPGDSYGFRFEKNDKIFIYSTDAEHGEESEKANYAFIDFFKNADLLIFDAQYRYQEAMNEKKNWGHSSNIVGVELAERAGVKRLCLFHNEPGYNDKVLFEVHKESERYLKHFSPGSKMQIYIAYDGYNIEL